ncbi:MAG: hypothetical protein ABIT20_14445 [Gemmatimonadaceae bacterium]
MALDMSDHLLVAPQVATGIAVIGVRQISTEQWPLSPVHQLPDAVRAPEHAPVGVHSHDDHVVDPAFREECEQFVAIVRNRIDSRNLD